MFSFRLSSGSSCESVVSVVSPVVFCPLWVVLCSAAVLSRVGPSLSWWDVSHLSYMSLCLVCECSFGCFEVFSLSLVVGWSGAGFGVEVKHHHFYLTPLLRIVHNSSK